MILTPSTPRPTDAIYAAMWDAKERDPIQGGDATNRATVPMGRGFALWQRMNAGAQLVWIDDAEGHPRAITPTQYRVLQVALRLIPDGVPGMTMRQIAAELQVAPSTVSRALTKFVSWGLFAYVVGRGRWAGLVIFRATKDYPIDRFRKAARERVRRWKEAAERRVSRLLANVAPYVLEEGRGYDTLTAHVLDTTVYKGATLTAQRPWTPEELRDAGII